MLPNKTPLSNYFDPRVPAHGLYFNQNMMAHNGVFNGTDVPFPYGRLPSHNLESQMALADHVAGMDSLREQSATSLDLRLDARQRGNGGVPRLDMYSSGMAAGIDALRSQTFGSHNHSNDHLLANYRSTAESDLMKQHLSNLQKKFDPNCEPSQQPPSKYPPIPSLPPYNRHQAQKEKPDSLPDLVPQKSKSGSTLPPPPQLKPRPVFVSQSDQNQETTEMNKTPTSPDKISNDKISSDKISSDTTPSVEDLDKMFSWTAIDGVRLPVLMREDLTYLSVRIVESKLLAKFPNTYPKNIRDKPPLISHYVTPSEAVILNHINTNHLSSQFGQNAFTVKDLVVKMEDFLEFYSTVKTTFKNLETNSDKSTTDSVDGGWVQMNNTIVPYIYREDKKYVPLSVIRYAAGLLTDVQVEGLYLAEKEAAYLNTTCVSVGLTFNFTTNTKLVVLESVRQRSPGLQILELPKSDPFSQAHYVSAEKETDNGLSDIIKSINQNTNHIPQPSNDQLYPYGGPFKKNTPDESINRQPLSTTPTEPNSSKGKELAMLQRIQPKLPNFEYRHQHYYRLPPYTSTTNTPYSNYPYQMSYPFGNKTAHHGHHTPNISQLYGPRDPSLPSHQQKVTPQPSPKNVSPPLANKKQGGVRRAYPIIKSVKLEGRYLSSVIRDASRTHYALLEAVCRAYFPKFPLVDFINIIEYIIRIKVLFLTRDEEECVIRFYGLKTNSLQCLKIVKISDLEERFSDIKKIVIQKQKIMVATTTPEREPIVIQPVNDEGADEGGAKEQGDKETQPAETERPTREGRGTADNSPVTNTSHKRSTDAVEETQHKQQKVTPTSTTPSPTVNESVDKQSSIDRIRAKDDSNLDQDHLRVQCEIIDEETGDEEEEEAAAGMSTEESEASRDVVVLTNDEESDSGLGLVIQDVHQVMEEEDDDDEGFDCVEGREESDRVNKVKHITETVGGRTLIMELEDSDDELSCVGEDNDVSSAVGEDNDVSSAADNNKVTSAPRDTSKVGETGNDSTKAGKTNTPANEANPPASVIGQGSSKEVEEVFCVDDVSTADDSKATVESASSSMKGVDSDSSGSNKPCPSNAGTTPDVGGKLSPNITSKTDPSCDLLNVKDMHPELSNASSIDDVSSRTTKTDPVTPKMAAADQSCAGGDVSEGATSIVHPEGSKELNKIESNDSLKTDQAMDSIIITTTVVNSVATTTSVNATSTAAAIEIDE